MSCFSLWQTDEVVYMWWLRIGWFLIGYLSAALTVFLLIAISVNKDDGESKYVDGQDWEDW